MKHLALIAAVGLIGVFFMVASEARNNANPFEGQTGGQYAIPSSEVAAENLCHCDSRYLGSGYSWINLRNCERGCRMYQKPDCPAGCIAR
ncbi:MAG: hypothetical protein AABX47_06860 [Nanoarchaeota archaeon]